MRFRDYQDYAIESVFRYFSEGGSGNPVVAMPTGTGKSVVIGGLIQRIFQLYPGQRVVMLTHVKELISQNLEKLLALWPTAPAGVYSAGLNRREVSFPITYAGIATAVKAIEEFGHIDLILIDECHLVSPKATTMYQSFINGAKKKNPNLKVIGFTATDFRMGQGKLTDPGGLFTDVCVNMTTLNAFNWFLQEGYLSPLVPRPTFVELDTRGVKVQQGEYNLKQLQAAVDREEVTYAALVETLGLAQGRQHWLGFAAGVEHAIHVADMLNGFGVRATCVHSKMPNSERDQRIADYRAGKYQAMINNGILTTGFDFAPIDLIVMLRPTRSPGLWVQMLGRGTRPVYADGWDLSTRDGRLAAIQAGPKRNCLVLDFAGNTPRLGPINDPMIPQRRGSGGGEAPVRICDSCGIYCHASLTHCPECGFEFPRSIKFGYRAGTDVLIKDAQESPRVETFQVDRVVYNEHRKTDRPPSLKVSYYCGLRKFDKWICLEHPGGIRNAARRWWQDHTENGEPPETIREAFERLNELLTPTHIRVWVNKSFPEVMGYEHRAAEAPATAD